MIRKKFGPAFQGIMDGLSHRSIRLQFLLGGCAVLAGALLGLSSGEWIAVILCIGLVISMEIMNTAVEFLCDYLTEEADERIRKIKDLSAGAVLTASLAALAAAAVILVRHF